jgi:hypothetical protein
VLLVQYKCFQLVLQAEDPMQGQVQTQVLSWEFVLSK